MIICNHGRTVYSNQFVSNWQTVLTKMQVTPEVNYCEFVIENYNFQSTNSWNIIIGIVSHEIPVLEPRGCWIGLETGWGYVAQVRVNVYFLFKF